MEVSQISSQTNVIPKVGMLFNSKSAILYFMEQYMTSVKKVFTVVNSKVFDQNHKLRESLYWYEVKFGCKHGGTGYRNENTGQRESRFVNYSFIRCRQLLTVSTLRF